MEILSSPVLRRRGIHPPLREMVQSSSGPKIYPDSDDGNRPVLDRLALHRHKTFLSGSCVGVRSMLRERLEDNGRSGASFATARMPSKEIRSCRARPTCQGISYSPSRTSQPVVSETEWNSKVPLPLMPAYFPVPPMNSHLPL